MSKRNFLFILSFLPFLLLAQNQSEQQPTEPTQPNAQDIDQFALIGPEVLSWPQAWLGKWKGTLTLYQAGKTETRTFPMELHIAPLKEIGHWSWTIIYGSGEKADMRKYVLIEQDSMAGHFIVDEKNSILLDQYLIGNSMFSRFAVDNTLLFASYRLEGDHIISEITSGKTDVPRISGQGLDETTKVDTVKSFQLGHMQRAVLWKQ